MDFGLFLGGSATSYRAVKMTSAKSLTNLATEGPFYLFSFMNELTVHSATECPPELIEVSLVVLLPRYFLKTRFDFACLSGIV